MPDIFISYSSKDREQAELLTELLASAGLSVWIDKAGIGAATSWSGEISKAITDCKALIVLLSSSSVDSKNVTREVALAFERNKKILPIDIEPVALPDDFAYHLAGIQRAPMTNIDAIIRALGKLGLEATGAPQAPLIVKESDGKKSLMILPFEDLSPTGDNQWFADGIVSELINALSNIQALRVTDAATTKEFKSYKGHLTVFAREMRVRYFVQGDVRKFGDQIKISARLLDIDTGDHLWQESIKGTMSDVFDIQEQVAQKVVDGLKLHLTSEEKKKLAERGTESAEAYELSLRANEYYHYQTKDGYLHAAQLMTEAIKLDANYANAYSFKAASLLGVYHGYDRNPALLAEAESLCNEALRINPDLLAVYHPLSQIYMHQGNLDAAERAVLERIRKDPSNYIGHFSLGFFYRFTGQYEKAIAAYEEAVRLKPDDRVTLFNLAINCKSEGQMDKCKHWSLIALPIQERHLKLHPDDPNSRMSYALLLFYCERPDDARREAIRLKDATDGFTLFNTACLFDNLGDKQEALATFRKALEAGFRNFGPLKAWLTDAEDGPVELQGTEDYEAVSRMVDEFESMQANQEHA